MSNPMTMNRREMVASLVGAAALAPAVCATLAEATPAVGAGTGELNRSPVIPYRWPAGLPEAKGVRVEAAGHPLFAYRTAAGDFVSFGATAPTEVRITLPETVKSVRVSPKRLAIPSKVEGSRVTLQIPGPVRLLIEAEGQPALFLFADRPDTDVPTPDAPGVHYFVAGKVYDVGELRIGSNEQVYIEGGAVVRGCLRASSAKNVKIRGRGVLDGSYYAERRQSRRTIVLGDCEDGLVEGIALIEPTSWMIVLGACRRMRVNEVKTLGEVSASDGCDIVGCQHVKVENSFFRNGDDCVVIKSLNLRNSPLEAEGTLDFTRNVEDIEVVGCTLMSFRGGQAMEIGHEIRCDFVRNIRFRDIDVLAVHNYGAPFGIHHADRALIEDVLYENIRVEHHYDKLVDFRIAHTRWSHDAERGRVRNITLRNIEVAVSEYNPGYTCSLIGGYDAEHTIDGVRFENFRLKPMRYEQTFARFPLPDKVATHPDDIALFTKHASGIVFVE